MSDGLDVIVLENMRLLAVIGAEAPERQLVQEVRVDLEIAVEMSVARRYDRLAGTLDYAQLHARCLAAAQATPVALLEHLGERLLALVTSEPNVLWAKIALAKPGLLAGATPRVVLSARRPTQVAVGLGANVGDAPQTLAQAVRALEALGPCLARSSLYRTRPWGVLDQPDFYNAALLIETRLLPHAVLASLKAIERRFGRISGPRYGPRVLDCDLLDDAGGHVNDAVLTVPHPRLEERAFVLAPLAEISPHYQGAYERLSIAERESVVRLAEWPSIGANG